MTEKYKMEELQNQFFLDQFEKFYKLGINVYP